jgi:hypothetical protein
MHYKSINEREPEPPLRTPMKVAGDFWLSGWKAGYSGEPFMPPRGKDKAAAYRKGYDVGRRYRVPATVQK